MKQEIIDLYDEFTHRGLDRRIFMARLAELAGGTAAAATALAMLRADPAGAAIVPADDPRLSAEMVTVRAGDPPLRGYLARPASETGKLSAVLVVHENRGLNPHIEDVARRLATEGFMALALDFLSPLGGTPADNEDKAREMIGTLKQPDVVEDAKTAIAWLKARPDGNGKVGIVGFCWGGGVVGRVAAADPELDAGVVYYGQQPAVDTVANIKAPLLLNYAGQDERINADIPAFEEALKANDKTYTLYMYEGAQHAFNNDTSAARYNEAAAKLAWQRTVDFFKQTLATG
ncbi:MAG: dienelactone hydrolase family protein [Geminicoccaceae bacterium]